MIHRSVKSLMVLLISLLSCHVVYAQDNKSYASDNWLNWQENEVTSIPAFDLKTSIRINIDPHSQLQWYVDPNTISIGEDRIVRYVVLGVSKSGTVNAMYEGVFCKNGAYKTYARVAGKVDQATFEWRQIETPEWQDLSD
ncbi:MAG: CNP1-like family protein, partial [Saezia sp.]